jgi:hypothetical protein
MMPSPMRRPAGRPSRRGRSRIPRAPGRPPARCVPASRPDGCIRRAARGAWPRAACSTTSASVADDRAARRRPRGRGRCGRPTPRPARRRAGCPRSGKHAARPAAARCRRRGCRAHGRALEHVDAPADLAQRAGRQQPAERAADDQGARVHDAVAPEVAPRPASSPNQTSSAAAGKAMPVSRAACQPWCAWTQAPAAEPSAPPAKNSAK